MEKESEINSVILSNSLENLAERMINALYFPDLMQRPFEKRLVVVPDMAMKEFLVGYCVSHPRLRVCAGLQIQLLNDATTQLRGPSGKKVPSAAVLSLAIEEALWARGVEDSALRKYLSNGSEEKKGRRIAQLSDELARLFSLYGLHGVHFLKGWLSPKEKHWQKKLFCELFHPNSPWSYPIELYRGKMECAARIALFGFHYLSAVHLSFFTQRGASIYALSPSMVFWGDFVTDKEKIAERRRLMRKGASAQKIEVIQRYFEEGHPLLNNWGKLGREMLKNLDAFAFVEEEAYDFREVAKPTLLGGLKRSLLLLEQGSLTADDSLQIHSATSKLREVEAMFLTLEKLLATHAENEDPLRLRDVLIYAPDIAVYAPYIAMVLSQRGCPYSIHGLPLSVTSSAVRGFLL
ncbi:MAG: exodeoxyribonuclease V subunit gamma, partial [Chlamydiota bacterium]